MAELAEIAIEIDSTAAKAGADQAVQSAEKVSRSFVSMGTNVDRSNQSFRGLSPAARSAASDFERLERSASRFARVQEQGERNARLLTRSLVQEYARAQSDIKERVARGFLSPQEAEKLGRSAGAAYNKGLLSVIETQGKSGGLSGTRGQATYQTLIGQLKQVDQAGGRAATGMRTFASQLAQVAAINFGGSSRLGSLITSVSFFSLGALTSAGIMAGIAGISLLWEKYTAKAREAKARTDELFASLLKAARERTGALAAEQESDILGRLELAKRKADQERQVRRIETGSGSTLTAGGSVSAQTKQEVADAGMVLFEFYTQRAEKFNESEERRLAKAKQVSEELMRLDRQRAEQLKELATLEAQARGDTAEVALIRIADQVKAAEQLTAAEKERLKVALLTIEAINRQKQALDALKPLLDQLNKTAAFGAASGAIGIQTAKSTQAPIRLSDADRRAMDGKFLEDLADKRKKEYQAALQQIQATEQLRLASLNLVQGSGDLVERLAYVASTVVQFRAQMEAMNAAINATTDASERAKLEQQKLQQEILGWAQIALSVVPPGGAGNVARAGIGGAAAGSQLLPGLAGGLIGGALGVVGGFLGLGKKAEEEARAFARARKAWDEAFDNFGRIGLLAGSRFDQLARDFKDQVERLYDDLKKAFPGTRKSKEFRPEDLANFGEGGLQRIRNAAAQGDEYSKRVLAILERYNEGLAELARQREEELHYLDLDLDARQAALEGREDEADAIRLQIQQERELAEARQQFGDQLPDVIAAQLEHVQLLEREALAREQAKAAAEEAQRQQDIGGDLTVRKLLATGDDKGAADMRFQLEQERELRDAVADGISATNLELLKEVQALEAVGRAAAEAAAAEAKRKEELQASQDLDVRFLEAIGQQGAADDLRFKLAQERELEDARNAGRTQDFIDQLTEVLRLESVARDKADEEAAITGENAARAASASVKDVTGISEQTGVRIDSRLFTQTVILRQIEVNTRPNNRTGGTYVYAPANQVNTAQIQRDIDKQGAKDLSTTNSANGVRPTT